MDPEFFDLVVIGAGLAGERGANTAAVFGKRVAIVEKGRVGGAVATTGTLPGKTLRETALALSGLRARNLYGVDLSLRREATIADFMHHEMHHERSVTANERARTLHHLQTLNITLYRGTASFIDAHLVRVINVGEDGEPGEVLLCAEKILIATGSSPHRPPEFAFEDPRIHDSDEILTLEELPESLVVVGAGVIGSEYACTFAALGTQVEVVDGRDALLPFLDQEISHALLAAMERLGIVFHWSEKVTEVTTSGGKLSLSLKSGKSLETDGVLIAAGRSSNTADLNLNAAGITTGKRGLLTVNANYQTEMPDIYAAGDVIGFPALASTSMEQARVAMCHAFDRRYKTEVASVLPTGIYTIPEVSTVGETEESLKTKRVQYLVGRASYNQNARGQIIGDGTGFLKLLFDYADMKLLGVHVIGEQASELAHIGLMAMLTGSGVELFNRVCFNYPTLGELYKYAAYDALLQRMGVSFQVNNEDLAALNSR